MIPHLTIRPSNLSEEELEAFLNDLQQTDLYDYQYDPEE